MAQKTEKLAEETIKNLRELQTKTNDCVVSLGDVELRLRDLNKEIERITEFKAKLISDYDEAVEKMNLELKSLEKTYTKGEIDLVEGVVTYEVSE